MKNKLLKITLTIFIVGNTAGKCLATDWNAFAPPAASVSGAGGNTAPQITLAIQQDPHLPAEAKHINVLYQNGTIVLRGTVATDGDKQKINSIAERAGAPNISNEIVVKSQSRPKPVSPKGQIIRPAH